MEYILHIDTSADIGSAAISSGGKLIARVDSTEPRNHAALMNGMIENVCEKAGIGLDALSATAVCAGPGSYTGLRIAMATAKGLCYALNLPLIVDDRLSLMAGGYLYSRKVEENANIAAILVARENEYFIGIHNSSNVNVVPAKHVLAAEMLEMLRKSESLHIITSAERAIFYELSVSISHFEADITFDYNYWAKLAFEKHQCHEYVDLMTATALYLKQVFTHK